MNLVVSCLIALVLAASPLTGLYLFAGPFAGPVYAQDTGTPLPLKGLDPAGSPVAGNGTQSIQQNQSNQATQSTGPNRRKKLIPSNQPNPSNRPNRSNQPNPSNRPNRSNQPNPNNQPNQSNPKDTAKVVVPPLPSTLTLQEAVQATVLDHPVTIKAAVDFAAENYPNILKSQSQLRGARKSVTVQKLNEYLPDSLLQVQEIMSSHNKLSQVFYGSPVFPAVAGPGFNNVNMDPVFFSAGGFQS